MNTCNFILNYFFSRKVFRELIETGKSSIYSTIVNEYAPQSKGSPNQEVISNIYCFMAKRYRNEYVYKNTLFNKLLLGRHSINTTTALAEIPICESKADFILINGCGVVYEIKTELDTLQRLKLQIDNYYSAFDRVCVVTNDRYCEKLSSELHDDAVGIYVLNSRGGFSSYREPDQKSEYLDSRSIFSILRKSEINSILLNYYGFLPNEPPAFYYEACYRLFEQISIAEAHSMFLTILKKRDLIKDEKKDLFNTVPKELKSLVYFSGYKQSDYYKLNHFLQASYEG